MKKVNGVERPTWDESKKGEAKRPYRLWDAKLKKNMVSRNYTYLFKAHDAAWLEMRWWGKRVGDSIEVYDIRNGKLLGTYTRGEKSATYVGPELKPQQPTKEKEHG